MGRLMVGASVQGLCERSRGKAKGEGDGEGKGGRVRQS